MTNGIYAAVQQMQPADLETMVNRPPTESQSAELRSRHHAVLALCQLRDIDVPTMSLRFAPYVGVKRRLTAAA
jgi:hypothetical protein